MIELKLALIKSRFDLFHGRSLYSVFKHTISSKAKPKTKQKTVYNIGPAIAMVQANSRLKPRNFPETLEIAIMLGIDPRKPNQTLRGMVSLPYGTGKEVRVAVFAKGDLEKEAKDAGAYRVGADDLMMDIQMGKIDFERLIATPDMMPLVGRVARILGPRGLMPSVKLGTIVKNPGPAVKAFMGGQVEYRAYKDGQVTAGLGKVHFEHENLMENVRSFMIAIGTNKPEGAKGKYMKQAYLSSTMGKGVPVNVSTLDPSNVYFMYTSEQDKEIIAQENSKGISEENTAAA